MKTFTNARAIIMMYSRYLNWHLTPPETA